MELSKCVKSTLVLLELKMNGEMNSVHKLNQSPVLVHSETLWVVDSSLVMKLGIVMKLSLLPILSSNNSMKMVI